MGRIREWDVSQEFSVEVGCEDGEWIDMEWENLLPGSIVAAIQRTAPHETWGEIVIPFRSRGYYDPGRTYDPDTAYPPEGDDERTLEGLAYFWVDRKMFLFNQEESAALFDHYADEIQEEDLRD